MKINQASSSPNAPEKLNAILAYILGQLVPFQYLEFSQEPTSFRSYPDLPEYTGGTAARALNEDLDNFVFSPNPSGGTQKFYGFENMIDQTYLNDLKLGNITDQGLRRQIENEQLRLALRVASEVLTDLIGGSGIGNVLLGWKSLVADVADASLQSEVYGFTKAQIHASLVRADVQLDLSNDVTLRTFEELLTRELAGMGGSPVMHMNNYVFARMTSIAKKLGVYGTSVNDFGKPVDQFGNYKMVPVGLKYLPQTEDDGGTNVSSSIYIIDHNEADGLRYATNAGFLFTDFATLDEKPTGKSRLEFYGQLKIEDMKKFKRVSRVRL